MRDLRTITRPSLAGVGFLYPVPLATLSSLGGRIRRPCPRVRQPAARARKLAGQHPFLWVWPYLFLEAQSRLWDLGTEGETTLGPALHASNVSPHEFGRGNDWVKKTCA